MFGSGGSAPQSLTPISIAPSSGLSGPALTSTTGLPGRAIAFASRLALRCRPRRPITECDQQWDFVIQKLAELERDLERLGPRSRTRTNGAQLHEL